MTEQPVPRPCLNCETQLEGIYCHRCGQKDQPARVRLKHLLHDVLHDLLHYDNKVLVGFWLLVRRPGFLAEEYLKGRRARHMPPFRLYVVTSFLLFFTFTSLGSSHSKGTHADPKDGAIVRLKTDKPSQHADPAQGEPAHAEVLVAGHGTEAAKPAGDDQAADRVHSNKFEGEIIGDAPGWLKELPRRIKAAINDPEHFKHLFLSSLSKALFLLMPCFAAILLLLHVRSKSYFMDQMVVSLYHHSFTFLVILAMTGLAYLPGSGWGFLSFLLFFTPPVHLAITLQRLYHRGWGRSLVKAALASGLYGFMLAIGLGVLAVISLPK